ncbi:MAG: pseudouridine-5'-phosphate glycosidase, partial [Fimbriimonadales bacterium]|nr:pseudouridine-5'-phosphate glycosidase [Fimbriimonadales bacterium]
PPNPLPRADMDALLQQALHECVEAGVVGNTATPWLLKRLAELSGGRTVQVNLALLEANARLAGQIANALRLSP